MEPTPPLAGYDYGRAPHSPVTVAELANLKASASFGDVDAAALRRAGEVLIPLAEAMVDAWRAKIGRQPYLAAAFASPEGVPDDAYRARVKPRFVRWIVDLCSRPFDQAWLDYQEEIGLRHTPAKKNFTDGGRTVPVVPLRYLTAFAAEVIVSARERLAAAGVTGAELDAQHGAWTKAVLLSVALWSRPYARDGLW